MSYASVFEASTTDALVRRIQSLTPASKPLWGTMNVAQMFAHVCVSYEFVFTDKHKPANPLMRWLLTMFLKPMVVGDKPYSKNSRTAPSMIVANERDYAAEQQRLIEYLKRVQEMGPAQFEGRMSLSFGALTAAEWSTLFHKHLDHHLQQFGV
jgi:Protein of unknown function (DUF1569)